MTKIAALSTLMVFALSACPENGGGGGGSEAEARDAIPAAENLSIDLPGSSDGNAKPIIGQVAPFYLVTLGTAVSLNVSVGAFLTLVRIIVAFPVTSIDGDTYIWGPWHDQGKPGEYRLTVERQGGDYAWTLEGRRFGVPGDFQPLVVGLASPGRPRRGAGTFSMNFDLAKTIDPASGGEGEVHVTYDLERSPISLSIDAEKLAPAPGGGTALSTFHYTYSEKASGAGDLTFVVYGDSDDPGSDWETSSFHSQWVAGGAGRADVSITGGDMGSVTVTATECWNAAPLFRRVYYTDSLAWSPTEGSPSSCAL